MASWTRSGSATSRGRHSSSHKDREVMNLALTEVNAKRVSEILHKMAILKKTIFVKSQTLEAESTIINTQIRTLQTELENIKES